MGEEGAQGVYVLFPVQFSKNMLALLDLESKWRIGYQLLLSEELASGVLCTYVHNNIKNVLYCTVYWCKQM